MSLPKFGASLLSAFARASRRFATSASDHYGSIASAGQCAVRAPPLLDGTETGSRQSGCERSRCDDPRPERPHALRGSDRPSKSARSSCHRAHAAGIDFHARTSVRQVLPSGIGEPPRHHPVADVHTGVRTRTCEPPYRGWFAVFASVRRERRERNANEFAAFTPDLRDPYLLTGFRNDPVVDQGVPRLVEDCAPFSLLLAGASSIGHRASCPLQSAYSRYFAAIRLLGARSHAQTKKPLVAGRLVAK